MNQPWTTPSNYNPSIPNTATPTKAGGAETLGAATLARPVEVEVAVAV